jgi:hypothetical protein
MRPATRGVVALLLLVLLARPVSAGLLNGSFETGDLTDWTTIGDVSVVTSSIGANPTQGSFHTLLTTGSQSGDFNNFSGTDAVSAAALEPFLGLATGALAGGVEGSAITQTFTANAGETLRFNFNFLKVEDLPIDFAFVVLTSYIPLADTTTGPFSASGVNLDPVFGLTTFETGYRTFTFTFTTTDTYTISLGIVDRSDEFLTSALLIDNFELVVLDVVIPEPGSMALVGVAGLCLAACGRRLRREVA